MDDLRTETEAYLDNLAAGELVKVQALVVEWDQIAFCVGSLDGGSVANITGISTNFEDSRRQIRHLMYTYVPVFHMAEAAARRHNQEQNSVGFNR